VSFKIKSGNELGLFKLEGGKNVAQVVAARSLKGFYGNYTLTVEAIDGGKPPNAVTKDFNVCVLDYNDNKVERNSLFSMCPSVVVVWMESTLDTIRE
jgi:hypothetical protein